MIKKLDAKIGMLMEIRTQKDGDPISTVLIEEVTDKEIIGKDIETGTIFKLV